ncbi:MAG: hypothetical protein ACOZNI_24215 [Myxococcota bacterium]
MWWFLVLALGACGAEKRATFKEKRDRVALAEAVQAYWDAVRWSDAGRATPFLETPEERLALGRVIASPTARISDVKVVQVEVGAELPEERLPERREGVALVRVEVYDVAGTRLTVETVEQSWVKRGPVWFVDAEKSPVDGGRPW